MKNLKTTLIVFVLSMTSMNFCLGQTGEYRFRLRTKVKAKLDSLYPNATNHIVLNDIYVSDSTQEISINCHCPETEDMIKLVFDTNGNLRNKEVHYYGALTGLPDTILHYISKNESPTMKFDKKNMAKYYDNKDNIYYGVYVVETLSHWEVKEYILKFKPTGELISKEEVQGGRL